MTSTPKMPESTKNHGGPYDPPKRARNIRREVPESTPEKVDPQSAAAMQICQRR
jgi:hypothetical protein